MKENFLKALRWCVVCIVVFLISIFIHEIGHGWANSLRGVACSTGFNRVGDSYKFPSDSDFREEYSKVSGSLIDFGVPATLIMAIAATALFYRASNKKIKRAALPFAVTNSLLRLLPCLWVVLTPLLTGGIHVEDEYETGLILAEMTERAWFTYVPASFSIAVSVICISAVISKIKEETKIRNICICGLLSIFSFGIAMLIANELDRIFRINWMVVSLEGFMKGVFL